MHLQFIGIFCIISILFSGFTVRGGILDAIKGIIGIGTTQSSILVPSGTNLPNYFRIEVELVRLQNSGGIKSNGGSCDILAACDPIVQAYIDLDKPTLPFPGSLALAKIPQVFQVDNNNSPKINVVLKSDVCNKQLSKATVRAHVIDRNKIFSNSLISDFDCVIGGSVANSFQDAKWLDEKACQGKFQPEKIKLFVRSRIYRIDPHNCQSAV